MWSGVELSFDTLCSAFAPLHVKPALDLSGNEVVEWFRGSDCFASEPRSLSLCVMASSNAHAGSDEWMSIYVNVHIYICGYV